jgi:hypothetical protein
MVRHHASEREWSQEPKAQTDFLDLEITLSNFAISIVTVLRAEKIVSSITIKPVPNSKRLNATRISNIGCWSGSKDVFWSSLDREDTS